MPESLWPALRIAGGLALLVYGGERLVRHAAHFAVSHRMPKVVVGAVVIGFGTSLPELVVSLDAALRGNPEITLGNVVGSNIANVGLILGLGALLTTLRVQRSVLRVDLPLGIVAALLLLVWIGPAGAVTRVAGLVLLGVFAVYMLASLRSTQLHRAELEDVTDTRPRTAADLAWIVLGLAGIAAGARLLVDGAVQVATLMGVSKRVIAVSMVAVGTSLPELAALLTAIRKREADLAVGNIAGSNLFNLLFVLGTTATVTRIDVDPAMLRVDFPAALLFALLAFPFLTRRRTLGRLQGLALLACYAGYLAWTWGWRP